MIRRFAALLLLFFLASFVGALATQGQAAVSADTQDETLYPIDSETPSVEPSPYLEPGSETPTNTLAAKSPTASLPAGQTRLPSKTSTPATPTTSQTLVSTETLPPAETQPIAASLTPGRDLFGTEDAEMSGARVTPPPSETPGPSPTLTPSQTPTATPAPAEGFLFDPSWFFGGLILILVVLALGWFVNRIRRSGEFG